MTPQAVAALIQQSLADAVVDVRSPDNVHFEAVVISSEFTGKRPIARHQLVYRALGDLVGGEIHALSIDALTPDEARAAGRGA
jgi:acid stress-induced BolA-like protein IbaG/YrbA